jgi:hypothetical protein
MTSSLSSMSLPAGSTSDSGKVALLFSFESLVGATRLPCPLSPKCLEIAQAMDALAHALGEVQALRQCVANLEAALRQYESHLLEVHEVACHAVDADEAVGAIIDFVEGLHLFVPAAQPGPPTPTILDTPSPPLQEETRPMSCAPEYSMGVREDAVVGGSLQPSPAARLARSRPRHWSPDWSSFVGSQRSTSPTQ